MVKKEPCSSLENLLIIQELPLRANVLNKLFIFKGRYKAKEVGCGAPYVPNLDTLSIPFRSERIHCAA